MSFLTKSTQLGGSWGGPTPNNACETLPKMIANMPVDRTSSNNPYLPPTDTHTDTYNEMLLSYRRGAGPKTGEGALTLNPTTTWEGMGIGHRLAKMPVNCRAAHNGVVLEMIGLNISVCECVCVCKLMQGVVLLRRRGYIWEGNGQQECKVGNRGELRESYLKGADACRRLKRSEGFPDYVPLYCKCSI